jgi:capsid protein
LIAKGSGAPDSILDGGVVVDAKGRVTDYAICTRGKDGATPTFDHTESIENLIFDAYWNRFSSQYRGVSPLASAINMVQDVHEAFEFNIIKAKMHALFGVAILRKSEGTPDFGGAAGSEKEVDSATVGADGSELDLDPRTINMLDLNPDEDVKVIESGTPSSEFVEGSYLFIQVAMLALDIPVTCFDSRRSSFSARIADLNEYEVSAEYKRNKNKYVRQAYSDWVLAEIWNDPKSPWPLKSVASSVGMSLRDVQETVEWVSHGSPWLDKYQQIKGDQLAIDIGLDNVIDACRRRGTDFFENMDKQSVAMEYAKSKGVPVVVGAASDKTINDIVRQEVETVKAASETEE